MKQFTKLLFALLLSLLIASPSGVVDAKPVAATTYYEVSGQAQIFEATYHYRIKAGNKVVKEGFGQASKGAPEWGDFSETIKVPNKYKHNAVLELYQVSMEDGQEISKLIIPLNKSAGKVYSNQTFRNVRVYELK